MAFLFAAAAGSVIAAKDVRRRRSWHYHCLFWRISRRAPLGPKSPLMADLATEAKWEFQLQLKTNRTIGYETCTYPRSICHEEALCGCLTETAMEVYPLPSSVWQRSNSATYLWLELQTLSPDPGFAFSSPGSNSSHDVT